METPSFQTNKKPKTYSSAKKYAGYLFLFLIAAFFLVFIGFFSYFLYIEKFGDVATRQSIQQEFSARFTRAKGIPRTSVVDADVFSYIQPFNPSFGRDDATVTLIAFIDFECPFCRETFSTFEQIRNTYGPGVHIVFKHFPVEQLHPHATQSAIAAQCAHDQGQFWEYYELLFKKQELTEAALVNYARTLELDLDSFTLCLANQIHQKDVLTDLNDGIALGVRGTPTYFLNNKKIEGVTSKDVWDELIIQALQE